MEVGTALAPSLKEMKHVMSSEGEMLTKPFLDVCKLILPILDATRTQAALREMEERISERMEARMVELAGSIQKTLGESLRQTMEDVSRNRRKSDNFGAAMSMVKSDVGGNILRLESTYYSDPSKFNLLHSLVRAEFEAKNAKGSSSCTNAFLWLTRSMDFLVELFRNLVEHSDWTISHACTDSYSKTLKKWHGWLASSSFAVALKIVPDRQKFMEIIGGSGNVNEDMEKFCSSFTPLLEENHKLLASFGIDNLKAY